MQPADQFIVPIELSADVEDDIDLLIQYALAKRPEVNQLAHQINALCLIESRP